MSAVPPGEPFHRLARIERRRWWRSPYEVLALLVIAIVVVGVVMGSWEAIHIALGGGEADLDGDQLFPNQTEDIAAELVLIGLLLPAVLLTVRLVGRRPAGSVLSVVGRLRWRWLMLCTLPALACTLLSYGISIVVDWIWPVEAEAEGSWIGWDAFWLPAVLIVLLVPVQSAAEEVVFRGWLLQLVGASGSGRRGGSGFVRRWRAALRSPWPAIVVSSAAFAAGHEYTAWALADLVVWAMAMGWLAVRTGGVEAGIAFHATGNLAAFLLPVAFGLYDDTQGAGSWDLLVYDVPPSLVYLLAVTWLARRRRVARSSPPLPEPPVVGPAWHPALRGD